MKHAYFAIAALFTLVVVWISQYLGFQRGHRTALNHQKAQLVMTLDALDQMHAANVDGATRLNEEMCFRLASQFLEDKRYLTDPDIRALMPRFAEYWDRYCAGRETRAPMEQRFASLLAPAWRLETSAETRDANGVVHVSPSKLFVGELARLEPHLGLKATGCFAVNFNVPEIMLKSEFQVWHYGKPATPGGNSTPITSPCELSISVREVFDSKGSTYEVTEAITSASRRHVQRVRYDAPKLTGEDSEKPRHTSSVPQRVSLNGSEPVPVWVFAQGHGAQVAILGQEIEETAKRVEWALVLTLSVDKKN